MTEALTHVNGDTPHTFDNEHDERAHDDTDAGFDNEQSDGAHDDTDDSLDDEHGDGDSGDSTEPKPAKDRTPKETRPSARDRLAQRREAQEGTVTALRAVYDQELAALQELTAAHRRELATIKRAQTKLDRLNEEHAAQNVLTTLAYKELADAERLAGTAEKDRTRSHESIRNATTKTKSKSA